MGLMSRILQRRGRCEEYRAIVEFIRSGEEVKNASVNHPVRALASMQQVMGVEGGY